MFRHRPVVHPFLPAKVDGWKEVFHFFQMGFFCLLFMFHLFDLLSEAFDLWIQPLVFEQVDRWIRLFFLKEADPGRDIFFLIDVCFQELDICRPFQIFLRFLPMLDSRSDGIYF